MGFGKTAQAIMTPDPKFIGSGERLIDTIGLFFRNGIHYAPVITPTQEILGLLSEVSLLKASLRHYLDAEKNEKVYAHKDLLEPAHFVRETEPIEDVVKALIKSPSKRVLVMNDRAQLTGIISPKDVMRFLAGPAHQQLQLNEHVRKYEETTKTLALEVQTLQDMVHVYREAFDNSPLMMHSLDGRGKIVMANKKMHQMLGYDPGELVGKTLTDLYPHTMHELAVMGLEDLKRFGQHHTTSTQMVKADGHTFNVDVVSSTVKDPRGVFLATITISRPLESSRAVASSGI